MDRWTLPKNRFDELLDLLRTRGFDVMGPRIEADAIVYGPIGSANDLPIGWTDRQAPGSYRLEHRRDQAYFGYAVGPHSWKKFVFPSVLKLWQAELTADGFCINEAIPEPPRRALIGVRACELHALAIQDRVFVDRDGGVADPYYEAARKRLLIIAVECEAPAATCFCTSTKTGPHIQTERIPMLASEDAEAARQAGVGAARLPLPLAAARTGAPRSTAPVCDLVLTELDQAFVVRAESLLGHDIVERLGLEAAAEVDVAEGHKRVDQAAQSMGQAIDLSGVRALLHANQEHPRWDNVAARCLACANCTLVCPTCFCSSAEDVTDLTGAVAERVRVWDSCFNPDFGRVHGGNFRPSIRGRYRQWLTHKFASWFDQFDTSGCVGCGRCIAWCPAGISVLEEIAAIRGEARDDQ